MGQCCCKPEEEDPLMWVFYLPDDAATQEIGIKMRLSRFSDFRDRQATARLAGPVSLLTNSTGSFHRLGYSRKVLPDENTTKNQSSMSSDRELDRDT